MWKFKSEIFNGEQEQTSEIVDSVVHARNMHALVHQ